MDKKRYAVVKVIDGVKYYYMRHPGTRSWQRGRFLGYWTKKKSKAHVFYDQAPEDWPKNMLYIDAQQFILHVLGYSECTADVKTWFLNTAHDTASHANSLHYGRWWFHLKVHRWLYELPVMGAKLKARGEFYYVDLESGEKHFVQKIATDLSKFERYLEHPAKKAKRERRRTGAQMLADAISEARKDGLIP